MDVWNQQIIEMKDPIDFNLLKGVAITVSNNKG